MTDQPSIESLRQAVGRIEIPDDQYAIHRALDELERLRLIEAGARDSEALVTRLLKGSAHTDLEAHDARVRREALEEAAKKCVSAYWASVAPKGVGAMHPSLEFWRMALGLPERTSDEIDASILEARRLFSGGAMAIADERRRQIEQEGWAAEHDDQHQGGELAEAAACYARAASDPEGLTPFERLPTFWPWGREWYKPGNPRRALVKAGALIAAEIDCLDRAAAILGPAPEGGRV